MANLQSFFSRRRLCQSAVAAALVRPLAYCSTVAAEDEPGWIDAHVHVWTPDTEKYPLDKSFSIQDMQPKSFTPDQLFEHTRPADVAKVVLIQMSFYNFDNSYMLDAIAQHPGVFSGVAIVDHEASRLEEKVNELTARGVRGFRIHARGQQAGWPESAGMARLWRVASIEGLAVCPLINPSDLPYIEQLCRRNPETTVVIDHFARIGADGTLREEQLDQLCRFANYPNVYVKTSAFYALGQKQPPYRDLLPMIRRLLDAFGPQRLMWASDCPYQVQGIHTYHDSIALIRDADSTDLSQADKQWLLRGTAEKVFF